VPGPFSFVPISGVLPRHETSFPARVRCGHFAPHGLSGPQGSAHRARRRRRTRRVAGAVGHARVRSARKAKLPVPITKDNVGIVTDIWVNYQLLGHAAAHGDSLNDKKSINKALAGIMQSMRLNQFMNSLVASFKGDSGSEAVYA